MASDKVKRALIWLRTSFRITDKTTLPGEILGEIRPVVDVFGWDRYNPRSVGAGSGPSFQNANGGVATNIALLSIVPDDVSRLVIYASMSHNDPAGLIMAMIVRGGGVDLAVAMSSVAIVPEPIRFPLPRQILLQPGEQLIAVSEVAPAAGFRLNVRYKFVDLDPGEYVPAI